MIQLKKLVGQTAIYGVSSVIGRLLNYLLTPILTRPEIGGFNPGEYGVITEMYAYLAFLIVFLTYGLETAFFRFKQKNEDKKHVYSTALISLLLSSTLFVFFAFLFSFEISSFLGYPNNQEYVKWFSIIVGIDAVCSIVFAKLRYENKALKFSLVRVMSIAINILAVLFFLIVCPLLQSEDTLYYLSKSFYDPQVGVGYVFIANLIASSATLLVLLSEMKGIKWGLNYTLWKKMIRYSLPLMVAGLAGMINETVDRVFLKKLLPSIKDTSANPSGDIMYEIGIYGAFYKISIFMMLFIQTFRYAAEPFYFKYRKEKDSKKLYADVMKYFVIASSTIFLIVMINFDLFKHFIGTQFHDIRGFKIVAVLMLANYFFGLYYNLSVWYKLTDKTRYGAYISIFGAAITISLNFMLVPVIGIFGSATTTLVCYLTMTIVSFYFSRSHYKIPYDLRSISTYFILMIFIFMISQFYNLGEIINSIYILIFIFVAYVLELKTKKTTTK